MSKARRGGAETVAAASRAGLSVTRSASPSTQPPDARRRSREPSERRDRDRDRYLVISEHGRGGLGRVSRAHDRELGRDIAIKELISRGHLGEVRFLREALITARLEHPGIVPVYEAGRWPDGTPFYAMKLVSGRSLRELIAERTSVDERIALLHHVIAVADAIAYAHGRHIIHRDLKPGNVIVGEFGETIVIDWGLAKDLSETDEPSPEGGPFRAARDEQLTSTGSVLGTPAYMAPEQARGEPVDQRADVFAIGTMLWELCSTHKAPDEPRLRHALLRRAGIDHDLAIIIDKALQPSPALRYADAGALAADLKAFKAGARIAARQYSMLAMLAHWTRRHRALALSVLSVVVLAVAGTIASVRNIAAERDRADASEAATRRSQVTAEQSLDELTLKHAELLLTTDPSAAVDLLASYRGADHDQAAQIRAEAVGRGVARLRASPHSDSVRWAGAAPDGAIVSLSTDGTITRTAPDQTTTVVARGVSPRGRFAYAAARGLLAYGCDPADVCIWDVPHGAQIPRAPALRGVQLAGIALSPAGTKLALLSYAGRVQVFDVSIPAKPVALLEIQRATGVGILFADDDTLAVGLSEPLGVELVRMTGESQTLATHDNFVWDASPSEHRLVLATTRGEGLYVQTAPLRIVDRIALCRDNPTGVKAVPGGHTVAFSCREGTVGTWDLQGHTLTPLTHLEGHADSIAVSAAGDYLLAAGGNGTLAVIDLETKLITSDRGHRFHLTSLTPPTADYPFLLSGDIRGSIRAWSLPSRVARVSVNVHTRFSAAAFNPTATMLVATTLLPELTVLTDSAHARSVTPHIGNARYLEMASNGAAFAAYGTGEAVEIWSAASLTRQQVIHTGHGSVSRVAFLGDSNDFVTGGRDGRLVFWTATGKPAREFRVDAPIASFVLARDGTTAVIAGANGALWRTDADGRTVALRAAGSAITRLINIADSLAIGYANGDVEILDIETWHKTLALHASQAIRDLAVTPDGTTLAVLDNDDTVHLGHRSGRTWNDHDVTWTPLTLHARTIQLTADGILVALCSDGTVWLYSSTEHGWLCVLTGTVDFNGAAMSPDGKTVATFDSDGRIVWLDLELARMSLTASSQRNHTPH